MKLLLKILGGLVTLVLLLVVVAFFLPRQYRVQRSVIIAAPAATLFPFVADLRNWRLWGIWYERDPALAAAYSESPATDALGGWVSWHSETQGSGAATLTRVMPFTEVTYALSFEGMDLTSEGAFKLSQTEGGTKVVWSDAGDLGNNPVYRWFGLAMDGLIGGDFEAGLVNLKRVAEAAAKPDGPAVAHP